MDVAEGERIIIRSLLQLVTKMIDELSKIMD